jgi:hypothetical protein
MNFIAYAPHNNGGVVSVATNDRCKIFGVVVREEMGVVGRGFCIFPGIEGFVYDEHAKAIAGFEEFRGWRVMAGTDGVEAVCFQEGDFPYFGVVEGGCAEEAVVVVDVGSFEEGTDTIDQEAGIRVNFDVSDTCGYDYLIDRDVVFLKGYFGFIAVWEVG